MIIVTGGAGFIGSNLVAALVERGERVVVCDSSFGCDQKWRNLSKHAVWEIVWPDQLLAYLENHVADVKMIFHMGAISSTTERDVDLILKNNFCFSNQLWDWCVKNQVRFVYASSAATYGDGAAGFSDHQDIEYLKKMRPLNPYGWSKHLFDLRTVFQADHEKNAPPQWAGLKFFNVYGPNEYHKADMRSVVAKFYPIMQNGQTIRLFESDREGVAHGEQSRDFVWVGDCVAVMMWLMDHADVSGLFNVGEGKAKSFNQLIHAMGQAMNIQPKIEYIPMPPEVSGQYQYYTCATMEKLLKLGYNGPLTDLEDGVRQYVVHYLSRVDAFR